MIVGAGTRVSLDLTRRREPSFDYFAQRGLEASHTCHTLRAVVRSIEVAMEDLMREFLGPTTQTPDLKPQPPLPPTEDASGAKRREKGFRINPLARTKSTRRDSNSKSAKPPKPTFDNPPKTAPLQSEFQASSEMLLKPRSNQRRGKSAERAIASESEDNLPLDKQHSKEKDRRFVTGSKNVMNKAKTGGGHLLNKLGKLGRTGSNQEKELTDSEYVIKVINLPLIEQTRITRISKDLSSCRDKTEYWMPSLPWRCIE